MRFYIYVLWKNSIPIYAGLTRDLEARLKFHRRSKNKGKDFDAYLLVNTIHTYDKKLAEECEQTIISFIKTLNPNIANKYCRVYNEKITSY